MDWSGGARDRARTGPQRRADVDVRQRLLRQGGGRDTNAQRGQGKEAFSIINWPFGCRRELVDRHFSAHVHGRRSHSNNFRASALPKNPEAARTPSRLDAERLHRQPCLQHGASRRPRAQRQVSAQGARAFAHAAQPEALAPAGF